MDVCQSVIAALKAIGQTRVVDAQAMQGGGIEIMDVHATADDVKSVFVGLAV